MFPYFRGLDIHIVSCICPKPPQTGQFRCPTFAKIYKQRSIKRLLVAEAAVPDEVLHIHISLYLQHRFPVTQVTDMFYDYRTEATLGLILSAPVIPLSVRER